VQAALGASFNPAGTYADPSYRHFVPVFLGFIFSQPLLLAFWTAFAPQRFYHRLLWGLLLCAVLAFSVEAGALLLPQPHNWSHFGLGFFLRFVGVGFFLSIDMILFFMATAFLLLARRLFGWRLVRSDAKSADSDYRTNQFGIKHLLILTTITALVCGLFRTLAGFDSEFAAHPVAEVAGIVFQITVLLLPTALIPWFAFSYRKHTSLSVNCAIAFLVISEVVCLLAFAREPIPERIGSIMLAQFGGGASVAVSILVMQCCGYRMILDRKLHFVIREVAHGSSEYWATVALRASVLRQPLGLQYSAEELQGEADSHHFASYCGDRVIACLVLRPLDGGEMRMRQLAVVPELQRRGIGRALVAYSEAWASVAGYRRMILHARETAVAFYEKVGYSRRGDRFEEVSIPHWVMEKRLV
jgi:GNAT superfamily N-acetyltransferase